MKRKQVQVMKQVMTCLVLALLSAGSASAETITVTDGTGNSYGDCYGIGVDFDSGLNPALAPWTPALVAGYQYSLDSLSLRDNAADAGNVYLGVYTGYSAGVLSGFLGASTNAVDFSTVTNGDWAQFNFSGINVTADAAPGSGSGLLHFAFQTGTEAVADAAVKRAMHRIDGYGTYSIADYGSNVIAYGALQTSRALEYQAGLTLMLIPEPATMVLLGLGSLTILRKRK
jgi:hypothetical protein